VRSHHERLDGSGYPHGIAGPSMPLDVRILAVCDVYDALISQRVYREAWTHERAIALLVTRAGRRSTRSASRRSSACSPASAGRT
jgi:cyclic di-GMP phosphodiesterase